ncbi:MAG: hypothetical protein ACXVBV_22440 [Isosphaeraceae bacterium]
MNIHPCRAVLSHANGTVADQIAHDIRSTGTGLRGKHSCPGFDWGVAIFYFEYAHRTLAERADVRLSACVEVIAPGRRARSGMTLLDLAQIAPPPWNVDLK